MRFSVMAFLFVLLLGPGAQAETSVARDADRPLQITVYAGGLALVHDRRAARLDDGTTVIAFPDLSHALMADTVQIDGIGDLDGLSVIERAFDFDVLSPQTLLSRSVGSQVKVVETNPANGKITERMATVVSVDNGLILEIDGELHTSPPGRIVFPARPDGLRDTPTLTARVRSEDGGSGGIALSYLTSGLSWSADYTGKLNADQTRLDLDLWATLTNTTGMTITDGDIAVVAGTLNRAPKAQPMREMQLMRSAAMDSAMADGAAQSALSGYHLFDIERPVTLKDNETRQVALVASQNIPVTRTYVAEGSQAYTNRFNRNGVTERPAIRLTLDNDEDANLGVPLPDGVIRLYGPDASGTQRFLGESPVAMTPLGEELALTLGQDFDITIERTQTEFLKPSNNVSLSNHRIVVRNAKAVPVTVRLEERIPGDWDISDASVRFEKPQSDMAVWTLDVPAGGEASLTYRAQVRF